ncbi:MAG TPA: FtsX-like permease family protein [Planctomycetaceae bacterium]|nr:FtsX-like permease family protein [Planctomycetaceae bacterium]
MNLATIAWKSARQRSLSSILTSLSVALGVMLMVTVLVIFSVLDSTFSGRAVGYDLIMGPKGSPLQLVLSTVYHVNPPIENLPYRFFKEIQKDPRVEEAIPIAIGDTTEVGGFPIVGTIPRYFELDYAPKREFRVRGKSLAKPFDALIGARVAQVNGWDIGSTFKLVHGGNEAHVHDELFTVVGVLAPTGTPNDKSVFVHLDGFYQIQGHDKPFDEAIKRERDFFGEPPLSTEELAKEVARLNKKYGHEHHDHGGHDHFHDVPELQKDVTSILLLMKTPMAAALFAGEWKKSFRPAMAVNPIPVMSQLMTDVLGGVRLMLIVLTTLILVVSGIGIFVSIYNSMSARKREIGILRALGARRQTVFSIVLAESILLCVGGGLLGLLLGHGLVFLAAPIVEARSGIIMNPWAFEPMELALLPGLLLLASLAGFLPGLLAYRTDVADALQN